MNEVAAEVFVAISFDATIEKWCIEGSEFDNQFEYDTFEEALDAIKRLSGELESVGRTYAEWCKA